MRTQQKQRVATERSAFAKFRCGVAPIKIETGRYECFAVEERIYPYCSNIEDEMHVILDCSVYNDLRVTLLDKASDVCPGFNDLNNLEKFKSLFSERRFLCFIIVINLSFISSLWCID